MRKILTGAVVIAVMCHKDGSGRWVFEKGLKVPWVGWAPWLWG